MPKQNFAKEKNLLKPLSQYPSAMLGLFWHWLCANKVELNAGTLLGHGSELDVAVAEVVLVVAETQSQFQD
jgi:hypothetical protein